MPEPSSSGDLSAACTWTRREAVSSVKLLSSPGAVIFGPLGIICELIAPEMSKVVCGSFKEWKWVNRLGVVTYAFNPSSQKAEAG